MVDAAIARQKTARALHHLDRLRRAEISLPGLEKDEDLWNATLMDLQQAIQSCIDLAVHWCVNDGIGAPEDSAGSFELLARAGLIPTDLASRLGRAAGLRNLIVHQYGDLDAARVLGVIERDLPDLEEFLRRVRGKE